MQFVYQDWDVMKDSPKDTEVNRPEKRPLQNITPIRTFQQLQEARIRKRMTIMDVSEAVGIPVNSLLLYENGSEAPNEVNRKKLFDYFGIN